MIPNIKSSRGSILLLTLCLVVALAIAAYGIYDLSLGTYRLSQRNEYLARGKALADSEMEYIYFRFENAMVVKKDPATAVAELSGICDTAVPSGYSSSNLWHNPYTLRDPLVVTFQNTPEQWQVKRSITYDHTTTAGASVYNYFTVEVEVISTAPGLPFSVDLRFGRHMNNSVTSIFQYNVFGQGDVDFSPAGSCRITGDIASNGSLYIGGDNIIRNGISSKLEIDASVFYVTPAANSDTYTATDGTTQSLGVNTHDVYVTDPANPSAPPTHIAGLDGVTWGTSPTAQVSQMPAPINLFGGLSPADILDKPFGQLLGSDASTLLYRSVISPPPEAVAAAAGHNDNAAIATGANAEYPGADGTTGGANLTVGGTVINDSTGVSALRAYNQAGLIITVNGDSTTGSPDFTITGPAGSSITFQGTDFPNVITQTTMYDLREQKNVAITDIDVGQLATALTANASRFPGSAFNGTLYVYLANASSSNPAAIRLNNGATTPNYGSGTGFTVATNGGLYVRGDYNTMTSQNVSLVDSTGTVKPDLAPYVNPAVLMADAITVLSPHWDDSVVTPGSGVTDPTMIANMHDPYYTSGGDPSSVTGYTGVTRVAAPTATTVIPDGSPLPTPFTQTIAAGLLTGNTTQGGAVYSGGSNNLVRFLEDWNYNGTGDTVNFYGSFGQLFESQIFNGRYYSPSDAGNEAYIFNYPGQRNYAYNSILKGKPPASSPNITAYSRGNVFTW